MFAGSKFRNIQSRGQQGLGCSGCVLLSQMTTGEATHVISGYKEDGELKGVKMKFKMDVKQNKGGLIKKKDSLLKVLVFVSNFTLKKYLTL